MGALRFGPFLLDADRRRLERDGVEIPLQPKVFDTLCYFVGSPGRVITRDELLSQLWPDTYVGEAALTRCVKEIRRALGDQSKAPRFVSTIPSVGYRFEEDVEPLVDVNQPRSVRLIAVLPFRPLSDDERDPSLELGMADTLITRLSGLRDLVVRPLATVRRFTDLDQDPLEAGLELGVEAVVDGSLQRQDQRIRVSVRVLRCNDGQALFTEQYDEPFRDVFGVQDAVCRKITSALSVELDQVEAARIVKHDTDDIRAYREFLRGRLGLGRFVPDDAQRSIEHFEKALELDPRYAQAHACIAEANIVVAWQGFEAPSYYAKARQSARQALEIDPNLGSAWSCLATVTWEHEWNWDEADRMFRRAAELEPNVVDVWGRYSALCAFTGRADEAVELGRRAVEVDRTSLMAVAWLAQALHMAGRSEEAVAVGESVVAKLPDAPFALFILGISCAHLGRYEEAIDYLEQAAATERPDFLGVLAHVYVRAGKTEEAAALEASLREQTAGDGAAPIGLAMIHAARGDADLFFQSMERAFDQRGLHAVLIAREPLLEPLRQDPRATTLIRRLGLPG